MKKYAIKLTKNDDQKILEIFENKEIAMKSGLEYRKRYSREDGLLSLVEATFDENGNMIGGYRLHETFM